MNWGVIPDIFFDLIGRIVLGSLLMVLAVLIARGYRAGIEDILKQASQVSTAASFFTLPYCRRLLRGYPHKAALDKPALELPAAPERGEGSRESRRGRIGTIFRKSMMTFELQE
jgi:hypothetical protein